MMCSPAVRAGSIAPRAAASQRGGFPTSSTASSRGPCRVVPTTTAAAAAAAAPLTGHGSSGGAGVLSFSRGVVGGCWGGAADDGLGHNNGPAGRRFQNRGFMVSAAAAGRGSAGGRGGRGGGAAKAGGSLRTGTRLTMNLLLLLRASV